MSFLDRFIYIHIHSFILLWLILFAYYVEYPERKFKKNMISKI